jgi:hypothetical protein
VTRAKRIYGKTVIALCDFTAFNLDLFRIPKMQRQQERFIHSSFRVANKIRRELGEQPKVYKHLINRDRVEVAT